MDKKIAATPDEYIAQFPQDVQKILNKVRATIRKAAPKATERIGYGMPGYYQDGSLVWFGGHPNHIGFYPTGEGIAAFKKELASYKTSKGAVQFPLGEPIPYALITKIVKHRVAENAKNKKMKRK
ncbi:MAG: iron chaperone [Anaerolineae bacterium]